MVSSFEARGQLIKLPRFVKPRGRRGVKRDLLIQTKLPDLVDMGGNRVKGISGVSMKRKFTEDLDSPSAKSQKINI